MNNKDKDRDELFEILESEQQKICETGIDCRVCPYRNKCGARE